MLTDARLVGAFIVSFYNLQCFFGMTRISVYEAQFAREYLLYFSVSC